MTPPELAGNVAAVILARLWHQQPEGDPMSDSLADLMRTDHRHGPDDIRRRFWAAIDEHPDRIVAAAEWWAACPDETTVAEARQQLLAIAEGRQEATR